MSPETPRREMVFHLPAQLDLKVLAWVRQHMVKTAAYERVVLDFGEVREFQPSALVALLTAASRMDPTRVRTKGLTAQQLKLFQYYAHSRVAPQPS